MDQPTQFRSAFNGFNRDDVVRYMEYINNKHSAQVAQLSNELDFLRSKQDNSDSGRVAELEKQVQTVTEENDFLHCRVEELEAQLREAKEALENRAEVPAETAVTAPAPSNEELEAYRRAERVERIAKDRARKVGEQTTAAMAEASKQVDIASEMVNQISRQVVEQLNLAQTAVRSSRQAFLDAAQVLETLRAELAE